MREPDDRHRITRSILPLFFVFLLSGIRTPPRLSREAVMYPVLGAMGGMEVAARDAFSAAGAHAPTPPADSNGGVVEVILFLTSECQACQMITGEALLPLEEQYGDSLQVQEIEISSGADVEYLYQVAALYGLPRDEVDLPMLLIGEYALVGEEMTTDLPALVDYYRSMGGVAAPNLPAREGAEALQPGQEMRPNGFILAVAVLAGMVLSLLYALGRLLFGVIKENRPKPQRAWQGRLIPILCVIGLGVAGYLSYIEITLSKAVCGPVGDCNAVQLSPYARLWGVLPIGVLGMGGYIAILAAWWAGRRKRGWISSHAPMALFGMTFFGTVFSVYLTYLEPFVIEAVCLWCISSAILMTLLMLLSISPALESLMGDACPG